MAGCYFQRKETAAAPLLCEKHPQPIVQMKYRIPLNFGGGSKLFNGQFEIRQVVETGVVVLLVGFLLNLFAPLSMNTISAYIIVCGIAGFAALEITKRDSLVTFLRNIIRWLKIRKKPYVFNPNPEAFVVTGIELLEDRTSIREIFASATEGIREKLSKKRPEYIEGKTFLFAEDPLVESLRRASEDRLLEQEELRREKEAAEKAAAEHAKADATLPDMDGILKAVSDKFGKEASE